MGREVHNLKGASKPRLHHDYNALHLCKIFNTCRALLEVATVAKTYFWMLSSNGNPGVPMFACLDSCSVPAVPLFAPQFLLGSIVCTTMASEGALQNALGQ